MSQISLKEKVITYNVLGFKNPYNEKDILPVNQLKDLNFDVEDYIGYVDKYKWFWRSIPFVRNIAVCNSLPLGMSDEESDIDLFVVVESGYLYLVRFWLVVGLQILGVRRYGKNIKKRFCLSFLVDDSFDVKSVFLQKDYYMNIWYENLWWLFEDQVMTGTSLQQNIKAWSKNWVSKFGEIIFSWKIGLFLNKWVGIWQRLRAHKKGELKNYPKGVMFEESIIKCHDQDVRWDLRRKVLQQILKS